MDNFRAGNVSPRGWAFQSGDYRGIARKLAMVVGLTPSRMGTMQFGPRRERPSTGPQNRSEFRPVGHSGNMGSGEYGQRTLEGGKAGCLYGWSFEISGDRIVLVGYFEHPSAE
jgi:hypothetical protein